MLVYRFSDFTLSPRRRLLQRAGAEVPLIPRYFDLLLFLVEHRHEAVHRRDIFDQVWSDVIVSESALSQAVRTIRRALGDDSREPRFIRTVSRHGYRFVAEVIVDDAVGEREDEGSGKREGGSGNRASGSGHREAGSRERDEAGSDAAIEPLLEQLTHETPDAPEDDLVADAAERLHTLGTERALARLGDRPRHAEARALLRDARWAVPGAGQVPLLGAPGALQAIVALVRLRLRRAARPLATRWANAALGSGLAGAIAGALGGTLLVTVPGSPASPGIIVVLALVGLTCGGVAGVGVAAGLELAEAAVRSSRLLALTAGAAAGGALVGAIVQAVGRSMVAALVGLHLPAGGGLEGLAIGGAAGLGYGLATRGLSEGLAAPRGWRRAGTVLTTACCCGAAALALALAGRPLVGGTLHVLADLAEGAQTSLAPLGRLLGEPGFGAVTAALIATAEGAVFGIGLATGLTRRPRRTGRRAP